LSRFGEASSAAAAQDQDRSTDGRNEGITMSTQSTTNPRGGFTADEKAAMRERAREAKAEARRGADREAGLQDVLAKIAEMPQPDRGMAERLHALITKVAPGLYPKTWYGMPAYAKDGKNLVFFQPAAKFDSRYMTLGFSDVANLDDGTMWPTSYALTDLTPADEARIGELVRKAAS
jgi:uncharacterized protein YdhG (YjbR/CyaY superfamily)